MKVLLKFAEVSLEMATTLAIVVGMAWLLGKEVTMSSMATQAALYLVMAAVLSAAWLTITVIREWRKA